MKKIVDLEKWEEFVSKSLEQPTNLEGFYKIGLENMANFATRWLELQPDAEEKHGKWIDLAEGDYKCSYCNEILTTGEDYHPIYDCGLYCCPYCGAKMDLGEEE